MFNIIITQDIGVLYEKINLITPAKRTELIADLEERLGIKISRVELVKVDFLRDVADLMVFYFESEQSLSSTMIEESKNDSDED